MQTWVTAGDAAGTGSGVFFDNLSVTQIPEVSVAVDGSGGGDYLTIQAAIDDNPGVHLTCDVVSSTTAYAAFTVPDQVGEGSLVVNGSGAGMVDVLGDIDIQGESAVTLSNLSIAGGWNGVNGFTSRTLMALTIEDCLITCTGGQGVAFENNSQWSEGPSVNLTLRGTEITGCPAQAVHVRNDNPLLYPSSLTIDDCYIHDNLQGVPTWANAEINFQDRVGADGGMVTITSSTIVENAAADGRATVVVDDNTTGGTTLVIDQCTIINTRGEGLPEARTWSHALNTIGDVDAEITNTVIEGGSCNYGVDKALLADANQITLINCTLVDATGPAINEWADPPYIAESFGATYMVQNCIIADATMAFGQDHYWLDGTDLCYPDYADIQSNLLYNVTTISNATIPPAMSGLLVADPVFDGVGDYHISDTDSLANSTGAANSETEDRDGVSRLALSGASVVSQWDFDGDLTATVGLDAALTGGVGPGMTTFTTAMVGGEVAQVMEFAPMPGDGEGLLTTNSLAASGDGTRANEYTLLMDINWSSTGGYDYATLMFRDGTDSLWYIGYEDGTWGAYGNNSQYAWDDTGEMDTGVWQRAGLVVDNGELTVYLNGHAPSHSQVCNPDSGADGDLSLTPGGYQLFFTDEYSPAWAGYYSGSGVVNSLALVEGTLGAHEVAALGGPTAHGINLSALPSLFATGGADRGAYVIFGDSTAPVATAGLSTDTLVMTQNRNAPAATSKTLTVSNTGAVGSTLYIGIGITGADAAEFSADVESATVADSASVDVIVTWDAVEVGSAMRDLDAQLRVGSNDPSALDIVVDLDATVVPVTLSTFTLE